MSGKEQPIEGPRVFPLDHDRSVSSELYPSLSVPTFWAFSQSSQHDTIPSLSVISRLSVLPAGPLWE